jgi:hypothetical protein
MLIGPFSSGTAAGNAGAATANTDTGTRICGLVRGVYVQYNDSPPAATTDITIATKGSTPACPTYDVLAIANAATNGLFTPTCSVVTTAGAAVADGYAPVTVDDFLNIKIAGANAGDSITVWLFVE